MANNILTAERVRDLLSYDSMTGIFVWKQSTSNRVYVGKVAGCESRITQSLKYTVIKVDGRMYRAHRLAWLHVYGEWPPRDIDHRNGIGTNNRLSNLRLATDFENMQNLHGPMRSNKTSGLLGVSFSKERNRWVAQLMANGKKHFIGRFHTVDDANAAYLHAKAKAHPLATYGRE